MRDILNTFGTATTVTANTAVAFPNGVDAGNINTLGLVDNLYVRVVIGTKAPVSTDTITININHDAGKTGTGSLLVSQTFPAKAWKIGDELKVKIPVEHKRYLQATGSVLATTGVGLTAFLERG